MEPNNWSIFCVCSFKLFVMVNLIGGEITQLEPK